MTIDPTPPAEPAETTPPRRGRALLVVTILAWVIGLALLGFGAMQLAAAGDLRERSRGVSSDTARLRAEAARTAEQADVASSEADDLEAGARELGEGTGEIVRSTTTSLRTYNGMIGDFNRAVDTYNSGNISGSREIIESDVTAAIDSLAEIFGRERARLASMRSALARVVEILEA